MPSKRSDERTIGGPKPRASMLTSQNRKLVPQQHQLHVLGELGSPTANEQPQNSSKGKVGKGEEHCAILPGPANPPRAGRFLRRSAIPGIRARVKSTVRTWQRSS